MLAGLLHISAFVMDLLILLLLVRVFRPHLRWRLVGIVDDAARPLVDAAMCVAGRTFWPRGANLQERSLLRLCLLVLLTARFAVSLLV